MPSPIGGFLYLLLRLNVKPYLKSPSLQASTNVFPSVGGSDRILVSAAAASSSAQETLEVNRFSTYKIESRIRLNLQLRTFQTFKISITIKFVKIKTAKVINIGMTFNQWFISV